MIVTLVLKKQHRDCKGTYNALILPHFARALVKYARIGVVGMGFALEESAIALQDFSEKIAVRLSVMMSNIGTKKQQAVLQNAPLELTKISTLMLVNFVLLLANSVVMSLPFVQDVYPLKQILFISMNPKLFAMNNALLILILQVMIVMIAITLLHFV